MVGASSIAVLASAAPNRAILSLTELVQHASHYTAPVERGNDRELGATELVVAFCDGRMTADSGSDFAPSVGFTSCH